SVNHHPTHATTTFSSSHCYGRPRDLHSFPTRRSSDLHRTGSWPVPPLPYSTIARRWELPRNRSRGCRRADKHPGLFPHPHRTSRSEEHTSELQSRENLVCRLLLEKKKN